MRSLEEARRATRLEWARSKEGKKRRRRGLGGPGLIILHSLDGEPLGCTTGIEMTSLSLEDEVGREWHHQLAWRKEEGTERERREERAHGGFEGRNVELHVSLFSRLFGTSLRWK